MAKRGTWAIGCQGCWQAGNWEGVRAQGWWGLRINYWPARKEGSTRADSWAERDTSMSLMEHVSKGPGAALRSLVTTKPSKSASVTGTFRHISVQGATVDALGNGVA